MLRQNELEITTGCGSSSSLDLIETLNVQHSTTPNWCKTIRERISKFQNKLKRRVLQHRLLASRDSESVLSSST